MVQPIESGKPSARHQCPPTPHIRQCLSGSNTGCISNRALSSVSLLGFVQVMFAGCLSKNIVSGTIEPNGSSTVRSTLVRVRDCKQCRRCVWRSCSTFTGSLLLLDNALLECPTRMPIVQDGFRRRVTLQLCMYQGAVSLFRDASACPSKAWNSRLRAIDRLYNLIPVSKCWETMLP